MNRDNILNIIIEHTCELLPALQKHAFQDTDSLADLGANSIDRSEIVMLTMESLALKLSRVELMGPTNIGELADLIYAKLQ